MRTLLLLALATSTATAQHDVPLEAHLVSATNGYFVVNLSEKAYVALFSIPTEGGTPTLVYPWHSDRSMEAAGEHQLQFKGPLANSRTDYVAGGEYTTTLVLIASRTPLNLDSYGGHRTKLVQALGGYRLASSRDSDVMRDRLVHLVASPDTPVTVDSFVFHL